MENNIIEILIQQRNKLSLIDSQRKVLNREIFTLLEKEISIFLEKEFHSGTEKTFSHHHMTQEQRKNSAEIRTNLKDQWVLQPLKTLRTDKRKEEITDTSLVWYLELLFVSDPLEYLARKRDDTIDSTEEYLQQQNLIIQSLDLNLWRLNDQEIQQLFSTCTDHVRTGTIPMIHYRHQAIRYIPQLKEVFATAQPYKLNANEISYKIITLTQGPGKGKVIVFSYTSPLDEQWHEDRQVNISIYPSMSDYKSKLQSSLESISQKIASLQHIKDIFDNRYQQNQDNTNKNDRAIEFEKLKNRLSGYYQGMYTDRVQVRIDRAEEHKRYMQAPQYTMSMAAALRDLDLAIQDQTAKFHRLLAICQR
jgi:hypothetical protein